MPCGFLLLRETRSVCIVVKSGELRGFAVAAPVEVCTHKISEQAGRSKVGVAEYVNESVHRTQ